MNYSQITKDVFVGTMPSDEDYQQLRRLGVRLVINMRMLHGRAPGRGEPDIEYLKLGTFDSPLVPIPVEVLMRGAQAALRAIRAGGSVYVHCSKGRHRGPAMAAAILIARGMGVEEAMALIKARRTVADPYAGYVKKRILLFAEKWHEKTKEEWEASARRA